MAQPQREWFEKDYYKILGVADSATDKEITRAYRKLAKKNHPDANPGDNSAENRFKEVSAAYDVLGDATKRKDYDEVRRMGPAAGAFRGAPGQGGPGAGGFSSTFRVDDLGDLLGGLFNRGGRTTTGAGTRSPGQQRGDDLETQLHLSFPDAIAGITTTVNITSDAACSTCNGTGAAPGTSPVICSVCGGRGVRDDNQGFFSFSQPCRACSGTGMRIETPCPTCRGTGNERRARQIKVRIPAGVADGQRIRLKARGGAGYNGGPPGDLYVVVHVAAHEIFGRNGRDLSLTVPITFAEAALGATVRVPTLDKSVSVRIPPGTKSGKTFRVRGHGVPSGSSAGDLLVTVEIAVPQRLSDAEREAIEKLAAVETESPRRHLGV
jgi:molecular chaperone DnaJ